MASMDLVHFVIRRRHDGEYSVLVEQSELPAGVTTRNISANSGRWGGYVALFVCPYSSHIFIKTRHRASRRVKGHFPINNLVFCLFLAYNHANESVYGRGIAYLKGETDEAHRLGDSLRHHHRSRAWLLPHR